MPTLRNVIDLLGKSSPFSATRVLAARAVDGVDLAPDIDDVVVAADPYLRDAREARCLIANARLVSAVDGNPAAVLNMNAMRARNSA